ncbi:MAG TPA: alpha/beta hydrolase [Pyrinomonadaceae bacterium]|nr:alpha/beta hydrolase [Pyrinomonadaceae bacterium]
MINHGYAAVNGIRLHYAESGAGDKLVILLHGFPEFWYSWKKQLEALSGSFHVVAPDMRGYNLSDKPSRIEDYKIDKLVGDVIGLIDHFGAKQAVIVGHDWGAGVAWAVAQKYPDRVSRLAVLQVPLLSTWRANLTLKQFLRSWYMFFFQIPRLPEWAIRRKDYDAIRSSFADKVARKNSFTKEEIELYKEAARQPGALTGAINYYRANVFDRFFGGRKTGSGQSSRVRVHTLFIYGEQDFAILPETVKGLEKYIDAYYREVRVPDSGHWVQNEAPEIVNAALLDFLNTEIRTELVTKEYV